MIKQTNKTNNKQMINDFIFLCFKNQWWKKKNKNIWKKQTKQNKKIKNKMWIKNDKYLNITKKNWFYYWKGIWEETFWENILKGEYELFGITKKLYIKWNVYFKFWGRKNNIFSEIYYS